MSARVVNDTVTGKFMNNFCIPIVPFPKGNGKVGRLILFKECLNSEIMPFIIMEDFRFYYKRGINDYEKKKSYLNEICLLSQDQYRTVCKYFQII